MEHKSFPIIETKAAADADGTFEALVSVFGNVDHVGDRILPGAFSKTLERWQESGDPIPVILSHQWDNPMAHIGTADPADVKQSERGLWVKGTLDVGDNDVAKQVYRLLKRRSLKAFSFGYTVPDGGQKANDGVNDVSEIDLVEVGPTLKGANPEAQLQSVKSLLDAEKDAQEGDAEDLRRKADEIEHEVATDGIPANPLTDPDAIQLAPDAIIYGDELKGAQEGIIKAVWTAAYISALPDSAFLWVEGGGAHDPEGKTMPRSLRHFPFKDAEGAIDLPHLQNALARLPQSDTPPSVKERLTERAQTLLDNPPSPAPATIEDADEPPQEAKAQDPLRRAHDDLEHELTTLGVEVPDEPPHEEKAEELPETPDEGALRRRSYDLILETLIGEETPG